ncbi:Large ribosomal subunit protein bL28c [Cardamine amara subsp. amara]|uniref:Large ribosomal subunit protein bL28c n=1 Tax=Cardamine amara subsp. amara TaxID=228776 RepID=A0ABD0Z267_CARAN
MAMQGPWLRVASVSPPKSVTKAMSKSTELGFLTSQLSGVRISHGYSDVINRIALPSAPSLQPIVARRICPFTGKKANRASKQSVLL